MTKVSGWAATSLIKDFTFAVVLDAWTSGFWQGRAGIGSEAEKGARYDHPIIMA